MHRYLCDKCGFGYAVEWRRTPRPCPERGCTRSWWLVMSEKPDERGAMPLYLWTELAKRILDEMPQHQSECPWCNQPWAHHRDGCLIALIREHRKGD